MFSNIFGYKLGIVLRLKLCSCCLSNVLNDHSWFDIIVESAIRIRNLELDDLLLVWTNHNMNFLFHPSKFLIVVPRLIYFLFFFVIFNSHTLEIEWNYFSEPLIICFIHINHNDSIIMFQFLFVYQWKSLHPWFLNCILSTFMY